jgi:hypothetical protein
VWFFCFMKERVIISGGKRPFWQTLIAAGLFTVIGYLFFSFFTSLHIGLSNKQLRGGLSLLELALFLLPIAVGFSAVKDIYFDLSNNRYKEKICFGPFGFGSWKPLPTIEYVSIFKQPKANGTFIYETNLWYGKNRHFNLLESDSKVEVMEMGKIVAELLGVDLLDATVPNNYRWL